VTDFNGDGSLRIPTLAIHLDRQENFAFNKETQLFPIAGLIAAEVMAPHPCLC
jgi:aspartyl aminopeptidase